MKTKKYVVEATLITEREVVIEVEAVVPASLDQPVKSSEKLASSII